MIKNLICIISAALILTVCTSVKEIKPAAAQGSAAPVLAAAETAETQQPKDITSEEVIKTKTKQITLHKIEFSNELKPAPVKEIYNIYYPTANSGTHYYAEKGNVYIHIIMSVKNLDKYRLPCSEVTTVTAYYDGSNKYLGTPVAGDSNTGFYSAFTASIPPGETRNMSILIEVPEEVETSNKPLFLDFTVDGSEYRLKMR